VTNYPDEWANFEQRMKYKHGCLLYDFLEDEHHHGDKFRGANAKLLMLQIRLWASYLN
jgi:hypothetical protein